MRANTLTTCFFVIIVIIINGFFADAAFTTTTIGPKPLWNATSTDKLRHDLLLNYDKFARPAQHYNKTTVSFGIAITHVDFNELKYTFTCHSWVKLNWHDDKLKWNTSDYGDMESVHLADHEIWQPDLFLYNSATATAINHYGNTHAIVYSSGSILWVPPTQFTVLCELNLRYWPFDTQSCILRFGSWTYSSEQIDLQIQKDRPIEMYELLNTSEWRIIGTTIERSEKYYSCCTESYPDITITIEVQRQSSAYRALIITPAIVIILLILMTFWLPPQAGEKIILQGCIAIIICMYLLYFTQKLPAMNSHTPLVVLFFSASLYVVCFSLLISIIVIWISRTRHTYCLPWALKQPLMGWLGKWLGLCHYISQSTMVNQRVNAEEMRENQVADMEEHNSDDHQMIGGGNRKAPLQQDWVLFAAAIDRLAFIFYSILFAILAIAYSL